MTCRDKLIMEQLDKISSDCYGGIEGCPNQYGYLKIPSWCRCGEEICRECWDREIPGTEKNSWGEQKTCRYCNTASFTDEPFEVRSISGNTCKAIFNFCPVCGRDLRE